VDALKAVCNKTHGRRELRPSAKNEQRMIPPRNGWIAKMGRIVALTPE
jgi:hypothetical protein